MEDYHPVPPQDSLLLSLDRGGDICKERWCGTWLVPVPSPGADEKRRRGRGGREERMDTDHCGYAWGSGEVDGYLSLQVRIGGGWMGTHHYLQVHIHMGVWGSLTGHPHF